MRNPDLDKVRGLAVLLMFLDHTLSVLEGGMIWRLTLTRASLPLFMLVSGYLLAYRNPSFRRYAQLLAASAVSLILVQQIPGKASADVLAMISVAVSCWPIARRWPIATMAIASTIGYTFAGLGDGYQPGYLLSLMCAGAMLRRASWATRDLDLGHRFADTLPSFLIYLGRWPLTWYLVHLLGLIVLSRVLFAA